MQLGEHTIQVTILQQISRNMHATLHVITNTAVT